MPRKKKAAAPPAATKTWKPLDLYPHQEDAVAAYKAGAERLFLAWHRRAGKDVFGLDFARERMLERVGSYWHLFPFQAQAKRAIWNGIDARTGQRFIDRAFPPHMRTEENNTELSLTLENGSTWQMLGSDNYDRMVGSNPCGIIFSEWALCDPAAWEYIRPILVENKGWAMFITTFRGRNHAWRMFETVKDLEGWYADLRPITHTRRANGAPIITETDIEKEIAAGMRRDLVSQEFYCDPNAATSGAIFTRQHARLVSMRSTDYRRNSNSLRVAWGTHNEGIAAVVFQGNLVIDTHTFCEQNLIDAIQSVRQRHPHCPLIHHAIDPDASLFNEADGTGVVESPLSRAVNEAVAHGHVAAALNRIEATAIAREKLVDFAMSYAPYRERLDDTELTHEALAQALGVMNTAKALVRKPRAPMDYSRVDRGVI